jgi:ABC-type antimicrobial peptide transport system permease subunit
MGLLSNQQELVNSSIAPKSETYFLVTKDTINSTTESSILVSFFGGLCSICIGAYITIFLTLPTLLITNNLAPEDIERIEGVKSTLNTTKDIALILAILFCLVGGYYLFKHILTIKKIFKNDAVISEPKYAEKQA